MAQITWQNIAIPRFSERQSQAQSGGGFLDPAVNAFDKMFETHNDLQAKNRQNTIENNDMALQGQLAQVQSLRDLNAAEGQWDPATIAKSAGRMFTPDALTSAVERRRGKLQEGVVNEARPGADAIGSQRLSTEEATVAFRDDLIARGMKPEEANRRAIDYQNTNAPNEALYKKTRSENTRGLLERFGIPETREQIANFMDEADKTGIIYDRGAFENQLTKEFSGHIEDENRVRQNAIADLNMQNALNVVEDRKTEKANTAKLNAMLPEVLETGNFGMLINSGLPADKIMDNLPKIASIRFAASQPLPEEQKLFDQVNNKMLADANVILADGQTRIDAKTAKYMQGMGYSSKLVETAAEGIVSKDGIGRFLGGEDFGGKIQAAFNDLVHQQNIPEEQAGAIIVRAWQATAGDNKTLWFKNFSDGKFNKQIATSKAQYKTFVPLLEQIAADNKNLEQTSLALTTDIVNRTEATFSALEQNKLTGGNATMQDILDGVTTATDATKEGSPLSVAEEFKRDATKRQEQATRELGTPEEQARTAAVLKEVQDSLLNKRKEAEHKQKTESFYTDPSVQKAIQQLTAATTQQVPGETAEATAQKVKQAQARLRKMGVDYKNIDYSQIRTPNYLR